MCAEGISIGDVGDVEDLVDQICDYRKIMKIKPFETTFILVVFVRVLGR